MKILKNELQNVRIDNAILEMAANCCLFEDIQITRSKIQKMIEEGKITVNSKHIKASFKVKPGDTIEIDDIETDTAQVVPENINLDIIYEDDYFLIINKQKGLLTHPTPLNKTGTLVNALLYYGCPLSDIQGKERAGIVHRLDKNTSGLIMAAKTNEAHINLQKQIQNKTAKRKYLAVVYGIIENDNGTINKPLVHYMGKTVKMNVADTGKEAITHYSVIERYEDLTLLELELETGRTHQIRCHMSSINHPVFGDTLYGANGRKSKINLKTNEQLLMSYYLKLTHTITGKVMEFKLDEKKYDNDFKKFFNIIRSKR